MKQKLCVFFLSALVLAPFSAMAVSSLDDASFKRLNPFSDDILKCGEGSGTRGGLNDGPVITAGGDPVMADELRYLNELPHAIEQFRLRLATFSELKSNDPLVRKLFALYPADLIESEQIMVLKECKVSDTETSDVVLSSEKPISCVSAKNFSSLEGIYPVLIKIVLERADVITGRTNHFEERLSADLTNTNVDASLESKTDSDVILKTKFLLGVELPANQISDDVVCSHFFPGVDRDYRFKELKDLQERQKSQSHPMEFSFRVEKSGNIILKVESLSISYGVCKLPE